MENDKTKNYPSESYPPAVLVLSREPSHYWKKYFSPISQANCNKGRILVRMREGWRRPALDFPRVFRVLCLGILVILLFTSNQRQISPTLWMINSQCRSFVTSSFIQQVVSPWLASAPGGGLAADPLPLIPFFWPPRSCTGESVGTSVVLSISLFRPERAVVASVISQP